MVVNLMTLNLICGEKKAKYVGGSVVAYFNNFDIEEYGWCDVYHFCNLVTKDIRITIWFQHKDAGWTSLCDDDSLVQLLKLGSTENKTIDVYLCPDTDFDSADLEDIEDFVLNQYVFDAEVDDDTHGVDPQDIDAQGTDEQVDNEGPDNDAQDIDEQVVRDAQDMDEDMGIGCEYVEAVHLQNEGNNVDADNVSEASIDKSYCDSEFEQKEDSDGEVYMDLGAMQDEVRVETEKGDAMQDEVRGETEWDTMDIVDDDCHIENSDSEEDVFPDYVVFNPEVDMKNPTFQAGMAFVNVYQFREAVRQYGILNRRDLRFTINEKARVHVRCKEGCEWRIYASTMHGENTFQIKTYIDNHAGHCVKEFKNRHLTYKWLAYKYLDTIAVNPEWPLDAFSTEVFKTYQIGVSEMKLYRAKQKAIDIIQGTVKEQYGRIWDYLEELKRSDPESTLKLELVPGNVAADNESLDGYSQPSQPVFLRLYVCFSALKKGFKSGCRQVLGFDGTHLKGVTKGQLLVAVGIDANDQMFPLAFAAVEEEVYSTWVWFLELVIQDAEITNGFGWTFMTDKQKGLLDAIAELVPNAEHRHCMKHFANNFRKANSGLEGRLLLWKASKSNRVEDFNAVMEQMKIDDNNGHTWLADKPPCHWSMAHFRTFTKCPILTNNMCEAFNKVVRKASGKPIISMVEHIREYLMTFLQNGRLRIQKYDNAICPNIQAKLERLKELSGACQMKWSGKGEYQVKIGERVKYKVNLEARTCGCRYWDLTGIPCQHAIPCIYSRNRRPEEYVDNFYATNTQKLIYEHLISPINGIDLWPKSTNIPPAPPHFRKQPGRPKKKRTKDYLEREDDKKKQRFVRRNTIVRCGKCGQLGHNKRRCPNPPNFERMREEAKKRGHEVEDIISQYDMEGPSQQPQARAKKFILRRKIEVPAKKPTIKLPSIPQKEEKTVKSDKKKTTWNKTSWPLGESSNQPEKSVASSQPTVRRSPRKLNRSSSQPEKSVASSQPTVRRSPRKLNRSSSQPEKSVASSQPTVRRNPSKMNVSSSQPESNVSSSIKNPELFRKIKQEKIESLKKN